MIKRSAFFSTLSSYFGVGGNTGSGDAFPTTTSRRDPRRRAGDDPWSLPYSSSRLDLGPGASTYSLADPSSPGYFMPSQPYAKGGGNGGSGGAQASYPPRQIDGVDSSSTLALNMSNGIQAAPRPPRAPLQSISSPNLPASAYPPLRHTWGRIRNWCQQEYPELGDTLNWPALDADIDAFELAIGFALPPAVRESYLCVNGQEGESAAACTDGLLFGMTLLTLDEALHEWRFWRSVDNDPDTGANPRVRAMMSSVPPLWVREEYSCRGWIPLITDRVGNYIGVDLAPDPNGSGAPGQVILFGREFDTKVVLWRGEGEGGWGRWLQSIADELEAGETWELDDGSGVADSAEEDEDSVGYASYFSGGGGGGGRGGGDRGGEGAAVFRLTGEYRGWPVLEAFADKSMRKWSEVGLGRESAASGSNGPRPPSVRLDGADADAAVAAATAAAAAATASAQTDAAAGPSRGGGHVPRESLDGSERIGLHAPSHPLESVAETPGSPVLSAAEDGALLQSFANDGSPSSEDLRVDVSVTTLNSTSASAPQSRDSAGSSQLLSPPPPSFKSPIRNNGKQRERQPSAAGGNDEVEDLSVPPGPTRERPLSQGPPAAPLDLPTVDDVRAAQAAAMAQHRTSGRFTLEPGGRHDYDPGAIDLGAPRSSSSSSSSPRQGRPTSNANGVRTTGGATTALADVVVDPSSDPLGGAAGRNGARLSSSSSPRGSSESALARAGLMGGGTPKVLTPTTSSRDSTAGKALPPLVDSLVDTTTAASPSPSPTPSPAKVKARPPLTDGVVSSPLEESPRSPTSTSSGSGSVSGSNSNSVTPRAMSPGSAGSGGGGRGSPGGEARDGDGEGQGQGSTTKLAKRLSITGGPRPAGPRTRHLRNDSHGVGSIGSLKELSLDDGPGATV